MLDFFRNLKKVKFYTLGCKVNQYETQGIREQFLYAGFQEDNTDRTDIYIINSCTVTAQADRESRQLVRKALRLNPQAKIIVTGCYVEKDAAEILQIYDKIQIVPNHQKHRIIDFLNSTNHQRLTTNVKPFVPLKISDFKNHERAFVKIQDGCNNFCSYCKVPLVRGRSRSRGLQEIVAEVTRLVNRGFKEIVLTGICLGGYHYWNLDLCGVITSLKKIKGEFRLRLSSIEPEMINDRLIEKITDSGKVCPHLHIPLQSGDDTILKRMNRRYMVKDYLTLVAKIKRKIKDIAITTDVLVGFPGEGEENFRNTVRCLKEILPLRTHIFSFSRRHGTEAFNLQGRIEPQLIKQRLNLLKKVAEESSYKFRKGFLGRTLSVLIESKAHKESSFLSGYSENYIKVIVEDASKKDINTLVSVKVKAVDMYSTFASKDFARCFCSTGLGVHVFKVGPPLRPPLRPPLHSKAKTILSKILRFVLRFA